MEKVVGETLMSIYVNKALHKKIKMYCIKNDIGSIREFAEKILSQAVEKPKAAEREEMARQEAIDAGVDVSEEETQKPHLEAPTSSDPLAPPQIVG